MVTGIMDFLIFLMFILIRVKRISILCVIFFKNKVQKMNLFVKPLYIHYNSRLLSEATIFFIIITLIRFILPLMIVWRTDSFWIKESEYREMPDIDFRKDLILLLNVKTIANQEEHIIGFSTIDAINRILDDDKYLIPINIVQYEYDYDNDNRYDELKLILDIPVDLNRTNVVGFRLLTFFQYRLSERIQLEMESLADLNINDRIGGQYVRIEGHLEFVQRKPFNHRGYEFRFNQSIIPSDKKIHLEDILLRYSLRKCKYCLCILKNFIYCFFL